MQKNWRGMKLKKKFKTISNKTNTNQKNRDKIWWKNKLKSCLGIWRFMRENQGGERKKKDHWLPTKVLSTTRVVISVWLLSDVAHVALTMRPPLRAIYISIIFKNNIYIFIILKLSLHLYDNKIKTQMKI